MDILSEAYRALPPVTNSNYQPKGQYVQVGSLKTYVVGEATATVGVFFVYDVFGFMPQTLQGADRMAEHLQALVLIPDLLEGKALSTSAIPPDTSEKKAMVEEFRSTRADMPKNVENVLRFSALAKAKWPSAQAWGGFGLCWGGKVIALLSGHDSPLSASGQVHPGALVADDAKVITMPHICLASPGEPEDVVKQYSDVLNQKGDSSVVETYSTMFHGWMGGKADLENEDNAREFERGYKQVADFFAKHLRGQ